MVPSTHLQSPKGEAAVARALAALSASTPAVRPRAARALDYLLDGVAGSSWPEVAWCFSRLTWDGFPVEFTCTTADAAIRYTIEVAGPEVDNAERLDRALALLGGLGIHHEVDPTIAAIRAIQAAGPLRYGAWIGGRHDRDGDRYKLYAEAPADSSVGRGLVADLLGSDRLLDSRRTLLRMIGYEPGSARIELYFRADGLEYWEVPHLLRRVAMRDRAADILALVEEAYGRPVAQALPARMGFSYSVATGGGPVVFSLFCFARSLFGSDARVRRQVLTLAERHGWDLRAYERVSEPLRQRPGGKSWHGMVALVAPPTGPLALHIGVRPPE